MALNANALITLADLEEYLGDIDDSLGENIINRASQIIATYCDRVFESTVYTDEEYDGTGAGSLNLRQYPVTLFTRLQNRTTTLNEANFSTIDSNKYFVDTEAGIIERVPHLLFRDIIRYYRVTYTAGFVTIPDDLQEAAIKLSVHIFETRKRAGDTQSETIGDYSITYDATANTFRDLGLDMILDAYKKPPLC